MDYNDQPTSRKTGKIGINELVTRVQALEEQVKALENESLMLKKIIQDYADLVNELMEKK